MNVGIFRGMEAMAASEQRLAAVTSNLANAGTTGFKRVATLQHAEQSSLNSEHATLKTQTSLDWTQGPLQRTGVATDLALRGDGFFAVEGPEGEVYTRDGQFQITEGGDLVTQDGFPVAWDGARGVLAPVGEPIQVALDGSVTQGGTTRGKLKLVDFDAREKLDQERHGYFVAPAAVNMFAVTPEVHQYALEGSNVSTVEELVRLIQVQRAFEAGTNVVQMIGQTYERLNRPGR